MTFTREVMMRAREKIGKDYPLWCRINRDDLVEGGQTLRDAKIIAMTQACQLIRKHGQITVNSPRMFKPLSLSVISPIFFEVYRQFTISKNTHIKWRYIIFLKSDGNDKN